MTESGEEKKIIHIVVDSARGSVELEVPKTTKVQEVLQTAVAKLNLGRWEEYELVFKGEVLKGERPLVSYGIKDGDHLDLTKKTVVGDQ
ncbi:MAG: ubiquitin-like protein [Candidatus Bathyarchaeota archaeon]|nr:ubiquitin-like protein [Candidatus Bathyarchaeota archaeon]